MLVFFAAEAPVFFFFSMVARFSRGAAYGALRFRFRLEDTAADLRVGAIPSVDLSLFMDRQVPVVAEDKRRDSWRCQVTSGIM